jgi:hypothetical protein
VGRRARVDPKFGCSPVNLRQLWLNVLSYPESLCSLQDQITIELARARRIAAESMSIPRFVTPQSFHNRRPGGPSWESHTTLFSSLGSVLRRGLCGGIDRAVRQGTEQYSAHRRAQTQWKTGSTNWVWQQPMRGSHPDVRSDTPPLKMPQPLELSFKVSPAKVGRWGRCDLPSCCTAVPDHGMIHAIAWATLTTSDKPINHSVHIPCERDLRRRAPRCSCEATRRPRTAGGVRDQLVRSLGDLKGHIYMKLQV